MNENTINYYIEKYLIKEIDGEHGFFNSNRNDFDIISNFELLANSLNISNFLRNQGVQNKDICVLIEDDVYQQLSMFYACLMVGSIPMFLPNVKVFNGKNSLFKKLESLKEELSTNNFYVLSGENEIGFSNEVESIGGKFINLDNLVEFGEYQPNDILINSPEPNDIAYIQMTSASTGDGKTIAISHTNVIENVKGMSDKLDAHEEKIVSWLPLYHDMGLVGGELYGFCHGYLTLLMTPYNFLKKPQRWLQTITDYKCTLSPAPNFGYEHCVNLIPQRLINQFDLSSWKSALNGAEPIRYRTMFNFSRKFYDAGFRKETFLPVYGLAESTLASTFSQYNEAPKYLVIDNKDIGIGTPLKLNGSGELDISKEYPYSDKEIITFSVGNSVRNLEYELIDEQGNIINTDLMSGEIVLKGTSVALGYLEGRSIKKTFDNYFKTGDLGFSYNRDLYILDRIKNLIIRNGKNYISSDLENSVSEHLNIDEKNIAIFEESPNDIESDIVAIIEISPKEKNFEFEPIINEIVTDVPISQYVFVKKNSIPKTTSGKKRHFECRNLWNESKIEIIKIITKE